MRGSGFFNPVWGGTNIPATAQRNLGRAAFTVTSEGGEIAPGAMKIETSKRALMPWQQLPRQTRLWTSTEYHPPPDVNCRRLGSLHRLCIQDGVCMFWCFHHTHTRLTLACESIGCVCVSLVMDCDLSRVFRFTAGGGSWIETHFFSTLRVMETQMIPQKEFSVKHLNNGLISSLARL